MIKFPMRRHLQMHILQSGSRRLRWKGLQQWRCRFYPEYGKIEDEEVIQRHKEIEECYRKRNALS